MDILSRQLQGRVSFHTSLSARQPIEARNISASLEMCNREFSTTFYLLLLFFQFYQRNKIWVRQFLCWYETLLDLVPSVLESCAVNCSSVTASSLNIFPGQCNSSSIRELNSNINC